MASRAPGVYSTEVNSDTSVNSKNKNVTVIVGKANFGTLEPTEVYSKSHGKKLFGDEFLTDYGLIALNKVVTNAESVIYVRACKVGGKAVFSSETPSTPLFIAKEGGIALNEAVVSVVADADTKSVVYTIKDKDTNVLETITFSTQAESVDYINTTFDRKSTYLRLVDSALTHDFSTANYTSLVVSTPGTAGAKIATKDAKESTATIATVNGKYFGDYLNNAKVNVSCSVEGKLSLSIFKNNVLIESIGEGIETETFDEFSERVSLLSDYIEIAGATKKASYSVVLEGGDSGLTLDSQDYIDCLNKVADTSQFKTTTLLIPGVSDTKVISAIQSWSNGRQDCVALVDPPIGLRAYQTKAWADATGAFISGTRLDSTYMATYSPWVKSANDSGTTIFMPPSILIASLLCTNDRTYNTWDAPAGVKRGVLRDVSGLEYLPTKDDREIMYTNSVINPIIFIKDVGHVAFGNKTCRRTKYPTNPEPACSLNVRRMVNHVKAIIMDIALSFVFDNNDSFTWDSFKLKVDPVLRNIKDSRGLYDYEIVMDSSTVTPEKQDALEMPGIIRLTPTRAGEVIEIAFELNPSGVTFAGNNN